MEPESCHHVVPSTQGATQPSLDRWCFQLLEPVAAASSLLEIIGFGPYPFHKFLYFDVREQSVNRIVVLRQFCLRKQGVNLAMTNAVHILRDFSALHAWHKMMLVALRGWDIALAQGTNFLLWRFVPGFDWYLRATRHRWTM